MTESERNAVSWVLLDPACGFSIDDADQDELGAAVLWSKPDNEPFSDSKKVF
jgi:hypothetical protein